MEPTVNTSPGQFSTLTAMNVTGRLNCSPLWTADTITTSFCKFKVTVDVYVVITLCVLGIVANVFSAIVLRHAKAMRSTTRYLLQMLAVSDSLYLVTCLGHQTLGTLEECTSWGRNNLDLVWAHAKPPTFVLSNVAQTVSVWLVLCVTADRWLTVTYPLRAARLSTVARARRVVVAVWLVAVAYSVPRLFERQVVEVYDEMAGRRRWSAAQTALRAHPVYVVLYDTALFFLLRFFLPLFLLIFFNVRLLCTVKRSRRLAQTLAASSCTPSHHRRRANDTNNSTGAGGGGSSERAQHVQQPDQQQQQHLSSDSKLMQCSQQQQHEQRNIQCCRDTKLQQKHQCDTDWQQLQRLTNDNENLQLQLQQCSPAVPCDSDSECVPIQYHQQCPSDIVRSSQQQRQYSSDTSEQPLQHLHSCQPCVTCSDSIQRWQQQNNTHHSPNDSTNTPLHQHAQPKSDNKRSSNNSVSKSERAVLKQHQMSGSQKRDNQQQHKQKQCGGQTQMLVVVVVVFFICELPDFLLRAYMSVYAVRSVIDPGFKDVYVECYRPLLRYANVFSNFLLTVNSSINFVIYVLVSRHFRLVMVAILLGHKHKLRELVTHIN